MQQARKNASLIGWVILICGITGCSSLPPLEDAISRDNTKQALDLINRGEGLKELDTLKRTPLHWAAIKDNVEVARLLIAKGLSVEAKAQGGATPLYVAASNCHVAASGLLLDEGASVDVADDAGLTPLIAACGHKDAHEKAQQGAMVELLLLRSANPNTQTCAGWTALHYAAEVEDPAALRKLLAHGADLNAIATNGYKPIHNAALFDRQANAFLLFDAGAIPEATPKFPAAGARSYRFAAQYMESKSQSSVAIDDYRAAAREFLMQVGYSREWAKQYDKKGNDAFVTGLGEAVLMGALAGFSHTNVTYTSPNPNYWWSLKDGALKQADICQKLAGECTAKAAALEGSHKS